MWMAIPRSSVTVGVVFRPTNTQFDTEFLDVIRVSDGKIIQYTQYLDTHHIAKIAGLP